MDEGRRQHQLKAWNEIDNEICKLKTNCDCHRKSPIINFAIQTFPFPLFFCLLRSISFRGPRFWFFSLNVIAIRPLTQSFNKHHTSQNPFNEFTFIKKKTNVKITCLDLISYFENSFFRVLAFHTETSS